FGASVGATEHAREVRAGQPLGGLTLELVQRVLEALADDPFHREERDAMGLADAVDRDDAGMREPRDALDLAPEALLRVREVRRPGAQALRRARARRRGRPGEVDAAHPAAADALLEAILAELLGEVRRLACFRAEQAELAQHGEAAADLGALLLLP